MRTAPIEHILKERSTRTVEITVRTVSTRTVEINLNKNKLWKYTLTINLLYEMPSPNQFPRAVVRKTNRTSWRRVSTLHEPSNMERLKQPAKQMIEKKKNPKQISKNSKESA